MEWTKYSWDMILVPLSICLTLVYHLCLWNNLKDKNSMATTMRTLSVRRKAWFLRMLEDGEKKSVLIVQSLRNTIMTTILVASIAILLNSSLAVQTNNAYTASQLFQYSLMASSAESTLILKFAASSIFLLASFFCSSMAVGCLSEAGFHTCISVDNMPRHSHSMLERGCTLAVVGDRLLFLTVPLLVWMFGPVAMAVASLAMIWVLYQLDFTGISLKT